MRKKFVYPILAILGFGLLLLVALRLWDERADRAEWARLAASQPTNPVVYDPVMVTDLPEPAQRFFNYAIKPEGRPVVVHFMRWSDANPDKTHRLQPFGGKMSDFREVQGFRVPFKVEAGNMFGTNEYFVFFKATVTAVRFLAPADGPSQRLTRETDHETFLSRV